MRINAGSLQGMKVIMPDNKITRPTLSKVRESVMDMLSFDINGAIFWDLFAGSGAMGLHAASRGAQHVVFIEEDRAALKALTKNISELKRRFEAQKLEIPKLTVIKGDLKKSWQRTKSLENPSIVWADPPYAQSTDWISWLKQTLVKQTDTGAQLWVEMASDDAKKQDNNFYIDPPWKMIKNKKYGNCSIISWSKNL